MTNTKPNCCKECLATSPKRNTEPFTCCKLNCPCHTKLQRSDLNPFEHGEEGTHGVCNKHNIGGKSVCCECTGKTDCSNKPQHEGWEAEFDSAFDWIEKEKDRCKIMYGFTSDDLKSFVRTHIEAAQEDMRRRCLEVLKERLKRPMNIRMDGYTKDSYTMSDLLTVNSRTLKQANEVAIAAIEAITPSKD